MYFFSKADTHLTVRKALLAILLLPPFVFQSNRERGALFAQHKDHELHWLGASVIRIVRCIDRFRQGLALVKLV